MRYFWRFSYIVMYCVFITSLKIRGFFFHVDELLTFSRRFSSSCSIFYLFSFSHESQKQKCSLKVHVIFFSVCLTYKLEHLQGDRISDTFFSSFQFNFVGRILGPRGMTTKQLEQETGCKIMVRGRGSMRDKKKVTTTRGNLFYQHSSVTHSLYGISKWKISKAALAT